mmetsp:Transcript_5720/g.12595  ORF Transcript_5720/g.12595 Transcript_5720/m.12595 type:complete len:212 (-) Transcript_5720:39-674(-)
MARRATARRSGSSFSCSSRAARACCVAACASTRRQSSRSALKRTWQRRQRLAARRFRCHARAASWGRGQARPLRRPRVRRAGWAMPRHLPTRSAQGLTASLRLRQRRGAAARVAAHPTRPRTSTAVRAASIALRRAPTWTVRRRLKPPRRPRRVRWRRRRRRQRRSRPPSAPRQGRTWRSERSCADSRRRLNASRRNKRRLKRRRRACVGS